MKTFKAALIGDKNDCLSLIDHLSNKSFKKKPLDVIGITFTDSEKTSSEIGRLKNTFITDNYLKLLDISGLDLIVDLTEDSSIRADIEGKKPTHIQIIDKALAGLFIENIQLKTEKGYVDSEYPGQVTHPMDLRTMALKSSREEAQRQKTTAEGIIHGSPIPMFVINRNHRIIHWNRACEKLTGFHSDEMIGTDRHWEPFYEKKRPLLADLIIEEDYDTMRELYKHMNFRKSPLVDGAFEAEHFFAQLGEKGTHLYINAAPIKDTLGTIQGAIVTYQDFSDRIRMTRELEASEEETRRQRRTAEGIIYGSPTPMFVIDKNHLITHWNKACEKLTGFRSDEMIGTDRHWEPFYATKKPLLADVLIDNDPKRIKKTIKKMKLSKSPIISEGYEAETYLPHLGDNGTHLYINAAPIKDDAGKIQGAIVTYQDFSDRVKMTQELKKHDEFIQNLIENSIDGIIATDPKGKIVIFNRGAAKILGYLPVEMLGKMTYTEILSEEMGVAIRRAFYGRRFGPRGKILNMEVTFLNKDEETIPLRLSGALLFEEKKEMGSVVFIQDLREIHKLQKEKAQAEQMAAIGRTVAGVAHYIKNILNGLQGGAYVINSGMGKENLQLVQKGWGMVERNIAQMSTIVTDMLIYSKERNPVYHDEDPNELVREIIELTRDRSRIAGVKLVAKLDNQLLPVAMDKTAIHRCLLNLVSNAIDACTLEGIISSKGVVTIKTHRPSGGGVRFEIRDNGMGMSRKTQKMLFTDFFTTKGYKGTGLGLPVTQKIVDEHGGKLKLRSTVGKGTVFFLTLPERKES